MADEMQGRPAEVTYFDANRDPCDKADANWAHVITTDENGEETRYWIERDNQADTAKPPDDDEPLDLEAHP